MLRKLSRPIAPVVAALLISACGDGGARPGAEAPERNAEASVDLAASIPLEETPDPVGASPVERVAPTIRDVDGAMAALEGGFYDEVARALPGLSGAGLPLVEGELAFVTGRYDDAVAAFVRAAAVPSMRIHAKTREAEAHERRGRYDEALALLSSVATEPSAHRARLAMARIESLRGRDASAIYYRLIEAYNDGTIGEQDADGLRYVALAAAALGATRDANEAFTAAARADATDVETQLAWAALFLSKHDPGHAEESVRDGIAHNPAHPEAQLMVARVALDQRFDVPTATAAIDRALAVCPSLVGAHVLRAGLSLRDLDFEGVETHLGRALAVNPRDLEALSVRAAARFLAGDAAGYDAAKAAVLREHAHFAALYTIMAEYADFEHRYPSLVEFGREAVALDPSDARAYALLGTNLLRVGDEEAGLAALREAFQRDRYDVRVFNTLNLYDEVIPTSYERFEQGPFVFRMHREERPILERYAPPLLTRAFSDMRRRYRSAPEGKIHFEMYASEEHFSVRTSGLPRIGLQGVCFGKVVTAVSPAGGPYNFAQITWHELAHVFHLHLSQYRAPRWLTEGLAEYETDVAGLGFRRELDHALLSALERDALPPLALLNHAFTSARSAQEMMVAYYTANRVAHYLVDTYGFPAVVEMLRGYGRGLDTEAVFVAALGASVEEVDRGFRAHTRARLAGLARQYRVDLRDYADLEARTAAARTAPRDAAAQAAHAAALAAARQNAPALERARAALALSPSEPLALYLLARLGVDTEPAAARNHAERLLALGHDGYEVRLIAARAALASRASAVGKAHLEAAFALDPSRQEAPRGLLALAKAASDAAGVRAALGALAELDEHDRTIHAAYLDALVEAGDPRAVIAAARRAVYVDPARGQSHLALGRALLEVGERREGRFELESARIAEPSLGPEVDALLAR